MPAKGSHHPTTITPVDGARVMAAAINVSKALEERNTVLRELHDHGVAVRDLMNYLQQAGAPLGRQQIHRIVSERPRWTPKDQDAETDGVTA